MKRLVLFVPLLIFCGLGLLLLRGLDNDPSLLPSPLIDQPFPAFGLGTVKQPERRLEASALQGEVALVNVWATWCVSCRVEHPYLMEIAEAGVPIVGVNYKDDRAAAVQWLADYGDPYRYSLFDGDGRLGLDLGVYGAPETFLIDATGMIRHKHVGVIDRRVWQQELKPMLEALRAGGTLEQRS